MSVDGEVVGVVDTRANATGVAVQREVRIRDRVVEGQASHSHELVLTAVGRAWPSVAPTKADHSADTQLIISGIDLWFDDNADTKPR